MLLRLAISSWFAALIVASRLSCYGEELPNDSVELFKAFLREPPVLKELIYTRTLYIVPPIKDAESPYEEIFWGRLQPDAFLFRDLKMLADTTSKTARLNLLVGRYQKDYWSITTYDKEDVLECWTDDDMVATNNPVELTAAAAMNLMNGVLRMGAPLVNFKKADWKGNDFVTVSARGEPIKGTLVVADHKPQKLVFNVFENPFFSNRTDVVEYYYEKNTGLPYLPSRLKSLSVTGEKQKLVAEVQIVSVETSSANLGREFFEAKQFYVPSGKSVLIFTNKALYALRDGQLVLASKPGTARPLHNRNLILVRAVLLLVFIVPLTLLAWKFIRSKQTTTNPK